jgi:Ran GTPase-activating protein (RanGAP) involved in mRNA processing and transport
VVETNKTNHSFFFWFVWLWRPNKPNLGLPLTNKTNRMDIYLVEATFNGKIELANRALKTFDDVLSVAVAIEHHPDVITALNLSWNHIDFSGINVLAPAIAKCTKLTELNFSGNWTRIDDGGFYALARAIVKCTAITTLDLSYNSISDEGASFLAPVLEKFTNLIELSLQHNNISSDGTKALASALVKCTHIATLNFWGNNIGDEGAQALTHALEKCTELTTLDIHSNNIGDDGAKALAPVLAKCVNLTELNLSDNNIGDTGIKALAYALVTCKKLTQLNLFENYIGGDGIRSLAMILPLLSLKCEVIIPLPRKLERFWNQVMAQAPDRRAFFAFFAGSVAITPSTAAAKRFANQDGDNAVNRRVLEWLVKKI